MSPVPNTVTSKESPLFFHLDNLCLKSHLYMYLVPCGCTRSQNLSSFTQNLLYSIDSTPQPSRVYRTVTTYKVLRLPQGCEDHHYFLAIAAANACMKSRWALESVNISARLIFSLPSTSMTMCSTRIDSRVILIPAAVKLSVTCGVGYRIR